MEVDGDDNDEDEEDPQDDEDEAFIDDRALSELSIDDWMQVRTIAFRKQKKQIVFDICARKSDSAIRSKSGLV